MHIMKICVAGTGIIGGSICMALKRAGYSVAGWNRSAEPLMYAVTSGIIDEVAESFSLFDVVFVALPPEAAVEFINSNVFKDNAIVSDICGVKGYIEKEVYKVPRNFRYVGCHPMAGKEVSGIENACADLFDEASMVITSDAFTDCHALEVIRTLTAAMGFKYIVECTADLHDRKIAYTSQLAHIVSGAYVMDGELDGSIGFTGGSFQDMTRIAGVDEEVWSSLYLLNSENLSKNIGTLISSLANLKEAIDAGDRARLIELLAEGKRRFESGKNLLKLPDISVQKIK